jgi:hypothetical protein
MPSVSVFWNLKNQVRRTRMSVAHGFASFS